MVTMSTAEYVLKTFYEPHIKWQFNIFNPVWRLLGVEHDLYEYDTAKWSRGWPRYKWFLR